VPSKFDTSTCAPVRISEKSRELANIKESRPSAQEKQLFGFRDHGGCEQAFHGRTLPDADQRYATRFCYSRLSEVDIPEAT
jgi:hypothetical protein